MEGRLGKDQACGVGNSTASSTLDLLKQETWAGEKTAQDCAEGGCRWEEGEFNFALVVFDVLVGHQKYAQLVELKNHKSTVKRY